MIGFCENAWVVTRRGRAIFVRLCGDVEKNLSIYVDRQQSYLSGSKNWRRDGSPWRTVNREKKEEGCRQGSSRIHVGLHQKGADLDF